MEKTVSLAAFLTKLSKNVPLTLSSTLFVRETKNDFTDGTTVREGAITIDTAGGCVPIQEMGRVDSHGVTANPTVDGPMATHSLFFLPLAEMDGWH